MLIAGDEGQSIFTVLCQRRSPKRFHSARGKRVEQAYADRMMWFAQRPFLRFDKDAERRRIEQDEGGFHRLDDLIGFAEVYWDGGSRFMVDVWCKFDRRTKWGRFPDGQPLSPKSTYHLKVPGAEGGDFPLHNSTLEEKRQALHGALDWIERFAKAERFFVDVTPERKLANCLDLNAICDRGSGPADFRSEE